MSCTLLEFCRLQELETVRDYLFQSQKLDPQEEFQQTGTNSCPFGFNWTKTGQIIKLHQVMINYLHHPLFRLNIWMDKGDRSYGTTECDVCSLKVCPNEESVRESLFIRPSYFEPHYLWLEQIGGFELRAKTISQMFSDDDKQGKQMLVSHSELLSHPGFANWGLSWRFADGSRCLRLAQRSKRGEGRKNAVDRFT